MKIVVTGATGTVGRHLMAALLRSGQHPIGISRDIAKAKGLGLTDIVEGDATQPATLGAYLQDAAALYINLAATGYDLSGLIEACRAHKVSRLVLQSAVTVAYGGGKSKFSDAFEAAEQAVGQGCDDARLIRCADFDANSRIWAGQIRAKGVVEACYGPAETACIHERDIAEVAALMLTTEQPASAVCAITGPERISQAEKVRQIGNALGRDVPWREVPPDIYQAQLVAAGVPEEVAERTIGYTGDCMKRPGPLTDTVERLLGRPAIPFRQWAAENAAMFGAAQGAR